MAVYYNEFDRRAAAWLRELIRRGVIAPGDVDERDIREVRADDLAGYSQCHFFAGIGGWSYALRLAGVSDDDECWSASLPCQPFSDAGNQMGFADPRHLFPAFFRLVALRGPSKIYGEQVASALGRQWLSRIRARMAFLGYGVGATDLCSPCAGEEAEGWIVRGDSAAWERIINGAPNIRQRLYWMAHASSQRRYRTDTGKESSGREVTARGCDISGLADADGRQSRHGDLQPGGQHGQQPSHGCTGHFWRSFDVLPCTDGKARRIEPGSFPLAAGVPGRVGLLRGYGNAINPELAAGFIRVCEESTTLGIGASETMPKMRHHDQSPSA